MSEERLLTDAEATGQPKAAASLSRQLDSSPREPALVTRAMSTALLALAIFHSVL